ncbi:MAG: NAD(P)-dependent oxidoreductase [Candidatus Methylomirabilota bacterium]|nr:SDR family oxidoreductase [candidate division NC10 bacterium]PWB46174.1 MAG: NAD(P)-dependent oxidoreductase [candidate division NC10 bacterium]
MTTALVTGVSGGTGRAVAQAFVKAGWKVFGVDKIEQTEPVRGLRFLKADLAQAEELDNILRPVVSEVGRLDALVNNAAHQDCGPIADVEISDWDRVMAVNLRAIYLAIRILKPVLGRGSSIVNISSVHACASSSNISAYAASKGGVLAFTRALAVELGKEGIRVNAILPGAIDTQMLRDGLDRGHLTGDSLDERLKSLGARIPIGRVGRPEEIAQAVLFLADNERASFITGTGLVVDGGALAKLSTE